MNCFSNLCNCCSHNSCDNLSMISFTYGLRRFTKNAMLIFCTVASDLERRDKDQTLKDVKMLKDTFEKYRFEVDIHVDLTSFEIEDICDRYFSRDFSDYGAIAVVILAPAGSTGKLMARDKLFDEDVVVKHFKYNDASESLREKPKLYITEANRIGTATGDSVQYSVPFDDVYRHVLGFHIPLIMEQVSRSPLQIFCDRMNNPQYEDYNNLMRIIKGAVSEMEEEFPALLGKIETTCTTISPFTLPPVEPE